MQNDEQNSNNLSPDELRAQWILQKRADQITPDERTWLAAEIAKWSAQNSH
jgi:hypothetical protein